MLKPSDNIVDKSDYIVNPIKIFTVANSVIGEIGVGHCVDISGIISSGHINTTSILDFATLQTLHPNTLLSELVS